MFDSINFTQPFLFVYQSKRAESLGGVTGLRLGGFKPTTLPGSTYLGAAIYPLLPVFT